MRLLPLFALVVSATLAGCPRGGEVNAQGKSREPAPEVPPIPAALSLPADRAPVYADVEQAPALLGSNLDLKSLSRTQLTWTIGMDVSFLDGLDKDLVVKQLAADPRWRVGREEGGVVAVQRQPVADKQPTWHMPWHGYAVGEQACTRTGFTFSPRTRDWAWDDSEMVSMSSTRAAAHEIEGVKLIDDACMDQMGTALVIEGPIQLEIFESGGEEDRPHTVAMLEDTQRLREVPFSAKRITEDGFAQRMMPEGGVREGHASLELEASPAGLVLEAWQNPGAAGWTWLRILDSDLVVWEEAAIATATLERIGHSPDPRQQFLMQAEIPLPGGKPFSGTAEIWFVPEDGEAPRRVDSAPIRIPRR